MRHLLLALVLAAGCSKSGNEAGPAGTSSEAKAFGELTVDQMMGKLDAAKGGGLKLAVFDTNSAERYAKSHVPGAKWVEFDNVKEKDLPADKETTLVFYCANER